MTARVVQLTTVPETLGFLRGLIGMLRQEGLDVQVLSSPGAELLRFARAEQVEGHAVPMVRGVAPLRDLAALVRIVTVLRRVAPRFVHAHTPKAGLLGMLAAWLLRVPVRIYHVHGFAFLTSTGPRRRLLITCERLACRMSHRVLCVSRSVREVALREGLCSPAKITVPAAGSIDGVDAARRFNPAAVDPRQVLALRQVHRVPRDAGVIGFVGRLVPDKGLGELAEAWTLLAREDPSLHLMLAGSYELHDPLPHAVRQGLEHDDRVHRLGHHQDMPCFYAAIDVLALPTRREGFPQVLLEAAAMERPVVASSIPGCLDAVVPGVTGTLVPASDPQALARALEAYLGDTGLRRRHGLAGRERVLREFRPQAVRDAIRFEYQALAGRAVSPRGQAAKRLLDLAISLPALLFLAPLMAIIAVLVLAALGRPVCFRQLRPGRHERPFTLLKFRTMRTALDHDGRPLADSARLTRLGRWLRRTSFDELPSLWNVARGDMSLVGPRPLLLRYLPYFTPRERLRFQLAPGITGWSQVHGRNECSWDRRLEYDAWYVEHRSLKLDMRIMLMTIGQILSGRGVVVDPRSRMLNLDEERSG